MLKNILLLIFDFIARKMDNILPFLKNYGNPSDCCSVLNCDADWSFTDTYAKSHEIIKWAEKMKYIASLNHHTLNDQTQIATVSTLPQFTASDFSYIDICVYIKEFIESQVDLEPNFEIQCTNQSTCYRIQVIF